jgi:hypothetical protein
VPNKETYLITFLVVASLTFGMQYFVFRQLQRLIKKDFPLKITTWIPRIKWTFILMNIPVAYLFFRRPLKIDVAAITQVMLYPYTIWQFLMMMWLVILTPVVLARMIRNKTRTR